MVRGCLVAALLLTLSCDAGDDQPAADDAGAAGSAGAAGADGGRAGTGGDAPDAGPPPRLQPPPLVSPVDGATGVAVRTPLCWDPVEPLPLAPAARYRLFVDGLELRTGIVGLEGFAGPCTEPLAFEAGRFADREVVVRLPAGATGYEAEQSYTFGVRREHFHFFDTATQKRVAARAEWP